MVIDRCFGLVGCLNNWCLYCLDCLASLIVGDLFAVCFVLVVVFINFVFSVCLIRSIWLFGVWGWFDVLDLFCCLFAGGLFVLLFAWFGCCVWVFDLVLLVLLFWGCGLGFFGLLFVFGGFTWFSDLPCYVTW